MNNKRKVEIKQSFEDENLNYGCSAILYEDDKPVAHIIEVVEESDIRYQIGDSDTALTEEFIEKSWISFLNDNFDKYKNLPKINECSRLMQKLFARSFQVMDDAVAITHEDWECYYSEFTENDIIKLKDEVKKYGLDDLITFSDDIDDYKINCSAYMHCYFNCLDDKYLDIDPKFVPILEVANNYEIDFFTETEMPFAEFGSDEEDYVMRSFSDFYKDVLKNKGYLVDSISTEEISDGKYKCIVNGDYSFEVKVNDQLPIVANNIDSIIDNSNIKKFESIYETSTSYVR